MRRRTRVLPQDGRPPLSLLVGACVEVWAADPRAVGAPLSARRRLSQARQAWRESSGLPDRDATVALNPSNGAPYAAALAPGRFERHGLSVADVPALRAEAIDLLDSRLIEAAGRTTR